MAINPLTLRLPFSLVDRGWDLARLLAAHHPWRVGYALQEVFTLSGPEVEFARRLLTRRRNLWLWRSNQRAFCGDFIVVDMSSPVPGRRAVTCLELKRSSPLRRDVAGIQLSRWRAAVDEVAGRDAVITEASPCALLAGDADGCLHHLASS